MTPSGHHDIVRWADMRRGGGGRRRPAGDRAAAVRRPGGPPGLAGRRCVPSQPWTARAGRALLPPGLITPTAGLITPLPAARPSPVGTVSPAARCHLRPASPAARRHLRHGVRPSPGSLRSSCRHGRTTAFPRRHPAGWSDPVATKPSSEARLDAVVNLCKRRGFVFPCGEIYGGTRSAWDYGPLGVELKDNIKRQWWRSMVTGRDDIVGLDSSVILPAAGLGGLRARRGVRRPAGRVPVLPPAVPGRPPGGGVRRAQGSARRRPWPRCPCPNCGTGAPGPSRRCSTVC